MGSQSHLITSPLYSFAPRAFDRNGLAMSYLDEGQGEPVVMLHGNPTWSFYWRNLALALRGNYRCIVPDHIGMGNSAKPTIEHYDFSIKSRIDDVEALLEHLGVTGNVTLVMQDWGGMIGMGYAARHPGRIKRIVATNTGCTRLPKSKPFPTSLWLGRNTWFGRWLILKRNYFCTKAAKWCVKKAPLPDDVKAMYLAPYETPAHRLAVLKFVQTIPLTPKDDGYGLVVSIEESLKQFANVPTLLLWGMRDFVFDVHFLKEWQRHFSHAEAHTFPAAGHYLLEDEKDAVIGLVKGFLAKA